MVKTLTILGCTGTIGDSTESIVLRSPNMFKVVVVTAHKNVQKLAARAIRLKASHAVIADESKFSELKKALEGSGVKPHAGVHALNRMAREKVDVCLSAIVGSAALKPTLAAIEAGSNIALANKECLVMAGELMTQKAKSCGVKLLPVDSEHNALFQLLEHIPHDEVEELVLTASGGPFVNHTAEQLKAVTREQALKHPNWEMGSKITIDSATLMNKGLEVIEAFHLFPFEKEKISVVVHPESVIHGLITLKDGSQMAHLSAPDMRLPLAHAFSWPKRVASEVPKISLTELGAMHFYEADTHRFPCLKLAFDTLHEGGTAPAILNAANEVAVEAFLQNQITFVDIARVVHATLSTLPSTSLNALEELDNVDMLARKTAKGLL